jgi:hypothetical protein
MLKLVTGILRCEISRITHLLVMDAPLRVVAAILGQVSETGSNIMNIPARAELASRPPRFAGPLLNSAPACARHDAGDAGPASFVSRKTGADRAGQGQHPGSRSGAAGRSGQLRTNGAQFYCYFRSVMG